MLFWYLRISRRATVYGSATIAMWFLDAAGRGCELTSFHAEVPVGSLFPCIARFVYTGPFKLLRTNHGFVYNVLLFLFWGGGGATSFCVVSRLHPGIFLEYSGNTGKKRQ